MFFAYDKDAPFDMSVDWEKTIQSALWIHFKKRHIHRKDTYDIYEAMKGRGLGM